MVESREAPQISVCLPIYNGESTLPATLEALVAQSHPAEQIVVVDDGSTDGSLRIVRDLVPEALVIDLGANHGAAVAWNSAVHAAAHPWVKLLCQDDVLHPRALERQLAIAASMSPSSVMVASRRRIVDDQGHKLFASRGLGRLSGQQTGSSVRAEILRTGANVIGEPSAVVFRRDAFEQTDGFSAAAAYTIDVDMWIRLLEIGGAWCDREVVCDFRVSAGQWSVRLAHQQADEMNKLLGRLAEEESAPFHLRKAQLKNRLDVTARRALYFWLSRRRPVRSTDLG